MVSISYFFFYLLFSKNILMKFMYFKKSHKFMLFFKNLLLYKYNFLFLSYFKYFKIFSNLKDFDIILISHNKFLLNFSIYNIFKLQKPILYISTNINNYTFQLFDYALIIKNLFIFESILISNLFFFHIISRYWNLYLSFSKFFYLILFLWF